MFEITLKNYRGFEISAPARFAISPGFTAFVGANNSGKSTIIRFFHEFRRLFQVLMDEGGYAISQRTFDGLLNVGDWEEIFCQSNNFGFSFEILDTCAPDGFISKISCSFERNQQNTAAIKLWAKENGEHLPIIRSDRNRYWKNDNEFITGDQTRFRGFSRRIANGFYVGPFRNAISEAKGSYYDIQIGSAFIETWHEWKTGSDRKRNRIIRTVCKDIAHIFGFAQLEVSATSDKKNLHVDIDNMPFRLQELGAGLSQFIIVIANVAIRNPEILLIDEPELNLHPSLQIDFLTTLASYVKGEVLFATHSVGLARSVAENIYTSVKSEKGRIVKEFERLQNLSEFLGELSYSSCKDIGCDTILLVEGVTEIKAVQQFLRKLGKDHTTVVLPLGGNQLINNGVQHELAELKRLSSRIFALIDSERTGADASIGRDRSGFQKLCEDLGIVCHVTDRRAFENYLSEEAIQAEFGSSYRALSPYELLKDHSPSWSKSANWRIARQMTKEELLGTDIGRFLNSIA